MLSPKSWSHGVSKGWAQTPANSVVNYTVWMSEVGCWRGVSLRARSSQKWTSCGTWKCTAEVLSSETQYTLQQIYTSGVVGFSLLLVSSTSNSQTHSQTTAWSKEDAPCNTLYHNQVLRCLTSLECYCHPPQCLDQLSATDILHLQGEKQHNKPSPPDSGLLNRTRYWEMCVHLNQKLTISPKIWPTYALVWSSGPSPANMSSILR